jgi:hypothetical protein
MATIEIGLEYLSEPSEHAIHVSKEVDSPDTFMKKLTIMNELYELYHEENVRDWITEGWREFWLSAGSSLSMCAFVFKGALEVPAEGSVWYVERVLEDTYEFLCEVLEIPVKSEGYAGLQEMFELSPNYKIED